MSILWSIAWRNLWRHTRRSLITAAAMAIGVALCMATIAFSDGMYADMFEVMVEQQLGHVQVHNPDYPARHQLYDTLPHRAAMLASLDALPGTRAASLSLQGYALVGGATKSTGARMVGIDPVRDVQVSPLDQHIVEGSYLSVDPGHEILLGRELAKEIEARVGSEVVAVTQAADGSIGNDLYRVVGIARTGDVAMDKAGAWMHIADAETLFQLDDQAHGITLLTRDPDAIGAYAAEVREAVGNGKVEVETWWEASPTTAEMMGLRDATTWIMLGIVFAVAAFGVVNTMTMSVFERTRELGVLRALGLRPGRLVWLIVLESFFLAGVAATFGVVLGGLLDWYLVAHGLDFSGAMPEGFSFEGVMLDPVMVGQVRAWPILATVLSVFGVSLLASLWPAWRAARLQPVEAIRAE